MGRESVKAGIIRGKGGFTLMELAVVMAVAAILAAAAGRGFLGYCRYGEWRKRNEYAKTVYLAFQSELMNRARSGQLSGFAKLCQETQDGFCRLEGAPEDYLRYREGEALALYEILDPYIADKSIFLEGFIQVELNPGEGLVSRCCYGRPEDKGFLEEREFSVDGEDGGVDGSEYLQEEALRKRGIGCYQAGRLPAAVKSVSAPEIRNLRLETGQTAESRQQAEEDGEIRVSWQLQAENIEAWKRLSYQIALYAGEDKLCTVLLNPGRGEEDGLPGGYGGLPKRFWVLDADGNSREIQAWVCREGKEDWYCFYVSLDESRYEITCFLDGAAKKQKKTASFSDVSAGVSGFSLGEVLLEDFGWQEDWEISCTVIGYGGGFAGTAIKESNGITISFPEEKENREEGAGGSVEENGDADKEDEEDAGRNGDRAEGISAGKYDVGSIRQKERGPKDEGQDKGNDFRQMDRKK